MYQEFYANSHLMALPLIALSLFVGSFLAILYWVFVHLRDSSLPEYMSQLPLSDGPTVDGAAQSGPDAEKATVGRPIVENSSVENSSIDLAHARIDGGQKESSHE